MSVRQVKIIEITLFPHLNILTYNKYYNFYKKKEKK